MKTFYHDKFLLFTYKAWNSHKLETLVPPIHEVGASCVCQLHLGQNSETSMANELCVPTQKVGPSLLVFGIERYNRSNGLYKQVDD